MTAQDKIKAKTITIDELLAKIPDGAVIGGGEQPALLSRIHEIADRLTKPIHVSAGVGFGGDKYPFVADEQYKDKFLIVSTFYGAATRKLHPTGRVTFIPTHLHATNSRFLDEFKNDVLILTTTPVDRHGYVNNGMSAPSYRAIDEAGMVVAFVNPNVPHVYGQTEIHIDRIDYLVEIDAPVGTFEPGPLSDVDKAIGANVATLVEDGSTIQLGIGAIPDAVAQAFMDKKNLGIHTEMVTSSMADLVLAGVADGSKKTLYPHRLIGGFASGSKKLLDFMTENPGAHLLPLEHVNDPWVVAKNYKMCSINTCIEVDLAGQVASESIGPMQFSGTGGQNDTAEGAIHCPGGKSIIAFASAITKKDGTKISKIKTMLTPGSIVTLSRNNIDYLVTEYGIAPMKARSMRQRVDNLIAIAHPDFREQLRAEANKLMLW